MKRHHDPALAARLAGRPIDVDAMRRRLPDLGESLNTAAVELARDITLDKIDAFMAKLKGAETSLMHLRRQLAADIHGHGIG
jgi:hypothetical protein